MQNNNRKILDSLVSRTKIYLIVILLLLIGICIFHPKFIIPAIIIYILTLGYTYFANNKRKSEISQHLQDLTLNVNQAAKNSLIYSPIPLVILETDGNIIWKSTKMRSHIFKEVLNTWRNSITKTVITSKCYMGLGLVTKRLVTTLRQKSIFVGLL